MTLLNVAPSHLIPLGASQFLARDPPPVAGFSFSSDAQRLASRCSLRFPSRRLRFLLAAEPTLSPCRAHADAVVGG